MAYRFLSICLAVLALGAAAWTLKVQNTGPLGQASAASAAHDWTAAADDVSRLAATGPSADLSLAILKVPGPIRAGHEIVYLLTAANVGPDAARGIRLEDTLPPNSTFVAADTGCKYRAGVVRCDLGALAARGMRHLQITVRTERPGSAVNRAKLLSPTHDVDIPDRSAHAATPVAPAAAR